jgi:hypothetical protein
MLPGQLRRSGLDGKKRAALGKGQRGNWSINCVHITMSFSVAAGREMFPSEILNNFGLALVFWAKEICVGLDRSNNDLDGGTVICKKR